MKLGNASSTEADKGSLSGELVIATVPVFGNAVIGIIPCPERNQVAAVGVPWQRELKADLAELTEWGGARRYWCLWSSAMNFPGSVSATLLTSS